MIYQGALFTFVAAGVATVGGFTSKAAQGRGVVSTATTAILERGATSIPVANQDYFKVGDTVEISSSAGKEKSKMIGVGSIIISSNCPITLEHPAGATVTVVTGGDFICEETTAPTVSPSEAPSASPSEAPSASPSEAPTEAPTASPTPVPAPSASPTTAPSASPSEAPTKAPTATPVPMKKFACAFNEACDCCGQGCQCQDEAWECFVCKGPCNAACDAGAFPGDKCECPQ